MSENSWYYALNGNRNGPCTLSHMIELLNSRSIGLETKVWSGSGDWVQLKETSLAASMPISTEPPPLASTDVDNRFVWAVAAVPLIGSIFQYAIGHNIWWAFLAANIALCVVDEKRLKAAGHAAPKSLWAAIVPVYLWKRATLLGHKKQYLYAWLIAFGLSLCIDAYAGRNDIAESACSTVTEIIHNQFHQTSSCKAVKIGEELRSGFYSGKAMLDNGNSIRITIEERGNDIEVVIPQQ